MFAGLAALAVSQGIGRFAMTPILPMMQEEGLSLAQGRWLAAANYLGYLVGALSTELSFAADSSQVRLVSSAYVETAEPA